MKYHMIHRLLLTHAMHDLIDYAILHDMCTYMTSVDWLYIELSALN